MIDAIDALDTEAGKVLVYIILAILVAWLWLEAVQEWRREAQEEREELARRQHRKERQARLTAYLAVPYDERISMLEADAAVHREAYKAQIRAEMRLESAQTERSSERPERPINDIQ